MVSSVVWRFTGPEPYVAAIPAANFEISVTKPGRFVAKLVRIDLHRPSFSSKRLPIHSFGRKNMIVMRMAQLLKGMARLRRAMAPMSQTVGGLTKRLGFIAGTACILTVVVTAVASAQPQKAPQPSGPVTALVVMTPHGPATCDTWIRWRLPAAHPIDKAAVEYWAEGYLSGLAAGSHHDVIGQFRRDELVAWLDHYCTANPQTLLPAAINALGRQMLAHPGGPL